MKSRLAIYFNYILYWLVFFIFCKVLFLIYHSALSAELAPTDWFLILLHGFRLDMSTVGYLMLIPSLLFIITSFFKEKVLRYALTIYHVLILAFLSFIIIVDAELYTHWGFRLDTTPLLYITSPKSALASVPFWVMIRNMMLGIGVFTIFFYTYKRFVVQRIKQLQVGNWKSAVLFFTMLFMLFLPIRGSVGVAPINVGSAYFHENIYANHAAINVMWNVMYSVSKINRVENDYSFMDNAKAEQLFSELYNEGEATQEFIKAEQPNVILIMLESFTFKIIGSLEGEEGITPNFDQLTREGVLFSNFYASGDRTDKGLVAILSGYPAQPTTSVIKYPQKTQKLPFLSRDLKQTGYHTSFYYGGDIDFANMRSYIINGKFDHIITKDDFAAADINSKWGVHDHIMFNRFLEDINQLKQPFFNAMLTLSSHEPYDVPMETVIEGSDNDSKFKNSAYYTDQCLGNFIKQAKQQEWWDNTVIVLLADHGKYVDDIKRNYEPARFKIPMLWLGGALAVKDTTISTYASQTDLAQTLVSQLNVIASDYPFGKDIFAPNVHSFAYYAYNNGLGFLTDSTTQIYNNTNNRYTVNTSTTKEYGKAYLQTFFQEF